MDLRSVFAIAKGNWFLIGMAVACAAGFVWPQLSQAYKQSLLVDASIVLVMFCGGITMRTTDLWRQVRAWRSVGLSIVLVYGLVPAIFVLAAWPLRQMRFEGSDQLFEGFMILAAQSGTLASAIVITTKARANVALAVVVTVVNALLAAVATPLILAVTLAADQVRIDVGEMIARLAALVLVPVLVGQGVRPLVRSALERVGWLPGLLSQCVILSFMWIAIGNASTSIKASPFMTLGLILALLLLHVLILGVNHVVSRLATADPASRRALVICSSQKTIATGAYVWARYFPSNPLGCMPLLIYHVLQLIVDAALAQRWSRKEGKIDSDEAGGPAFVEP